MDKRIILGGAGVVVIAVAIAAAQMIPSKSEAPDDMVTDTQDNPFSGLDEIFNEEGPDLGMTEEEIEAEDEYLSISPDPEKEPAGETASAATENVPFKSCPGRPTKTVPGYMDKTSDGYATRSIYLYAAYRNVVDTGDCSCTGKVLPMSEVDAIKAKIAEEHGDDWNRSIIGDEYKSKYRGLRDQAEEICGGEF